MLLFYDLESRTPSACVVTNKRACHTNSKGIFVICNPVWLHKVYQKSMLGCLFFARFVWLWVTIWTSNVMPVLVAQVLGKTSGSWIMDNTLFQEHLEEYLVNYKDCIYGVMCSLDKVLWTFLSIMFRYDWSKKSKNKKHQNVYFGWSRWDAEQRYFKTIC